MSLTIFLVNLRSSFQRGALKTSVLSYLPRLTYSLYVCIDLHFASSSMYHISCFPSKGFLKRFSFASSFFISPFFFIIRHSAPQSHSDLITLLCSLTWCSYYVQTYMHAISVFLALSVLPSILRPFEICISKICIFSFPFCLLEEFSTA